MVDATAIRLVDCRGNRRPSRSRLRVPRRSANALRRTGQTPDVPLFFAACGWCVIRVKGIDQGNHLIRTVCPKAGAKAAASDMLSGIIAALLDHRMELFEAAILGIIGE